MPHNRPAGGVVVMRPKFKFNPVSSVGKRQAFTIYVDKRVFKAFKPIAEREFGSVSRALEAYMVSVIMKEGKKIEGW